MTNEQAREIMEIFEETVRAYRGRLSLHPNDRAERFIEIKRQQLIDIISEINPTPVLSKEDKPYD